MQLSKEDRQKHIDLSTPCQFHYFKRDWNCRGVIKKAGDLYGRTQQITQAKNALLGFLKIEDFIGREINLCHLCECNSNTDKVCINPAHLYFGTVSENSNDIPFEVMSERGKISGKIATENMTKEQLSERGKKAGKKCAELGITGFQQKVVCPHCDKQGSVMNMKRWHFDNCKHKPISVTLQDISNFIPESSSANLE